MKSQTSLHYRIVSDRQFPPAGGLLAVEHELHELLLQRHRLLREPNPNPTSNTVSTRPMLGNPSTHPPTRCSGKIKLTSLSSITSAALSSHSLALSRSPSSPHLPPPRRRASRSLRISHFASHSHSLLSSAFGAPARAASCRARRWYCAAPNASPS